MEFSVEVGTDEQREVIEVELGTFFSVNIDEAPNWFDRVLFVEDLERAVHELQGLDGYLAVRTVGESEIVALAKIVDTGEVRTLVLSAQLYAERFDTQTRCFVCMHEICHSLNLQVLPDVDAEPSYSRRTYLHNLGTFYDEYTADRFGYNLAESDALFDGQTNSWGEYLAAEETGFRSVILDETNYETLRMAIRRFRITADMDQFLAALRPIFDAVFVSFAHFAALADAYPTIDANSTFAGSKFATPPMMALVEHIRQQYEAITFDVEAGIPLVIDAIASFGIRKEYLSRQQLRLSS